MISVTKKYSDGKFSFVLAEDGKEKCECVFNPTTAEITELNVSGAPSEEELRASVLATLGFLENIGKTEAFYVGDGYESLFSALGFSSGKVSLIGYFKCCNK